VRQTPWRQFRKHPSGFGPPFYGSRNSGGIFDIDTRSERLASLDRKMAGQGFWDDREQARRIIGAANRLQGWVEPWRAPRTRAEELGELRELLAGVEDAELEEEWR